MRVLIIVNELLYTCGVSNHVYNLLRGIIDQPELEIILVCGGGNAIEKYRNMGVKVIEVKEIRHESRNLLGYIMGIIKLYKIIKDSQIDIIHSHHHYAASMAQKIKYLTGIKTILTNHGLLPEIGLLSHFPSDYIVAVSEHVVNYLREKGIKKPERIFLIRSGVIQHPFIPVGRKTGEKLRVIAASRFVPEKGLDIYIQAVAGLDNNYRSKADFYLAGEGISRGELVSLNKKLDANIIFLDRVEKISEKLYHYEIFINTPTATEGYPMVMIEAGFAQCTIITSNFIGVEYIFKDSIDGYIFDKSEYLQLRDKIKYVIDNFPKTRELANNYFKKVCTLFNLNKMRDDTITLYRECL